MIRLHHIVISGFGQYRDRLCGADYVTAALQRFVAPGVRVTQLPWNHDWWAEAKFIRRHGDQDKKAIVCLYAYSWGMGSGAVRLAERLLGCNVPVFGVVSCDGVYRHRPGLLRWLPQWRAFWPASTIRLPGNVDRRNVRVFVQRNSLPAGHEVVDCRGRQIVPEVIENVVIGDKFVETATHTNIDESRKWHNACVDLAAKAQLEDEGRRSKKRDI